MKGGKKHLELSANDALNGGLKTKQNEIHFLVRWFVFLPWETFICSIFKGEN